MGNRRKFASSVLLLMFLFIMSCAGGGGIVKVTKFAPPSKVSVEPMKESLRVTWKPSPDEANKWFDGYSIYYASKSLLLVPVRDLPGPIEVGKKIHEVVIPNLDAGKAYFIHVRARKKSGESSPPSIPERVGVPSS